MTSSTIAGLAIPSAVLATVFLACTPPDEMPQVPAEDRAGAVALTVIAPVVPIAPEDTVDPYVGTWDAAMVLGHLRSAGLLPRDLGQLEQPEMGIRGRLLEIEGAHLQVFIYGDAAARALHTEGLDSVRVTIDTGEPVALITSNNLAVLVSGGDAELRHRLHELFELPDDASEEREGPV